MVGTLLGLLTIIALAVVISVVSACIVSGQISRGQEE